ncbi:Imm10 family immunity protein [Deinococcus planocerae]|uniref:Imm10 family immunity protein n=1 Tax=Deinococcus planocerae TaxID=1737569 RepID=UPI0015E0C625|nr:Imm10 family immunity protein [Deinococcus planocerae]
MELEKIAVTACAVEVLEDLDTFMIALADDLERQEQVLELQRALPGSELEEQDKGTDMDTYCLVWNAGPTEYGALSSCVLQEKTLTLLLTPQAVEVFGVTGFLLQLELDETERAKLRDGLALVFSEREPDELILE